MQRICSRRSWFMWMHRMCPVQTQHTTHKKGERRATERRSSRQSARQIKICQRPALSRSARLEIALPLTPSLFICPEASDERGQSFWSTYNLSAHQWEITTRWARRQFLLLQRRKPASSDRGVRAKMFHQQLLPLCVLNRGGQSEKLPGKSSSTK